MAKVDPTFLERFGTHVDAMFHDIAHPTNVDSRAMPGSGVFFPFSRHKSWFDGHSYATGMFPFGNGKSQESSSEAVNCYYGAYLWSLVRHGDSTVGSDLTDFTRLLLAMEIRGAKTYWHMIPSDPLSNTSSVTSTVYNPEFQENYMVGNVGMLDVVANTWFGNDPLYVHMINAIPITAATAVLFDKEYVEQEYPFLMKSRSSVEMAWRGYTISIHAILDATAAWKDAQDLVSYELDSALSKSQALYWISQRPGFNVTIKETERKGGTPANEDTAKARSPSKNAASARCENNPACDTAGLTGECCPTLNGVFLGCCSRR
jgi:endo-1,3(4)-beta-glucanase